MADDELLGAADDTAEAPQAEGAGGGGASLMKYLPIIAVVLVVQIVMVYLVARWWLAPSPGPAEPARAKEAEAAADIPRPGAAPSGHKVTAIYEKLDPIVVNPAGTEGLRFLSATVHLGLSSPKVLQAIDSGNLSSKIRDRLIDVFRARTIAQLEPAHHEQLKLEIRDRLNEILGGEEKAVLEVYFQGFVLQ